MVAGEVGAIFHPSDLSQDPVAIAQSAIADAKRKFCDVVIIDTAGRLHVDAEMMSEIQRLMRQLILSKPCSLSIPWQVKMRPTPPKPLMMLCP